MNKNYYKYNLLRLVVKFFRLVRHENFSFALDNVIATTSEKIVQPFDYPTFPRSKISL
jgi:hypothetical protein